jgi:hypothetical protein
MRSVIGAFPFGSGGGAAQMEALDAIAAGGDERRPLTSPDCCLGPERETPSARPAKKDKPLR